MARASLPVSALDDPAKVRLALGACAKTLTGKPAAGSTQRRKRSVFYACLYYAALRPSEAVMLRESDLYRMGRGPQDRAHRGAVPLPTGPPPV